MPQVLLRAATRKYTIVEKNILRGKTRGAKHTNHNKISNNSETFRRGKIAAWGGGGFAP